MQISHVEVIPTELSLRQPHRSARGDPINSISVLFVRIETLHGDVA